MFRLSLATFKHHHWWKKWNCNAWRAPTSPQLIWLETTTKTPGQEQPVNFLNMKLLTLQMKCLGCPLQHLNIIIDENSGIGMHGEHLLFLQFIWLETTTKTPCQEQPVRFLNLKLLTMQMKIFKYPLQHSNIIIDENSGIGMHGEHLLFRRPYD